MRGIAVIAASFLLSTAAWAETAQERLAKSAEVLREIMAAPDQGIPQDLLESAECAVVLPNVKKAAFVVGGEYGRGFAICRTGTARGWGAPASVRMEGGSVGFQIGAAETDLIMLVMNKGGMEKLLGDKFTIGADASAAAGPVGRSVSADTNARMDAQILTWSRSKGAFAGVSLNGATLRNDLDENQELYGKRVTNREVIGSNMTPPASASPLIAELNRFSKGAAADRSADREQNQPPQERKPAR